MMAFVIAVLIAAIVLAWHRYPDSGHYQQYTSKRSCEAPGFRKYKYYEHSSEAEHRTAEEFNWAVQNNISKFTILFTAAAAGFAGLAYWEARRQAQAAEDQLEMSSPPILHISNVAIWKGDAGSKEWVVPVLEAGAHIGARAMFVNEGGHSAKIDKAFCEVYFGSDILPMYRPYDRDEPDAHRIKCGDLIDRNWVGSADQPPPGGVGEWRFSFSVPQDFRNGMRLWMIGNILYKDRFDRRYFVLFARKYIPSTATFYTEKDNPDYEGDK